MGPREEAIMAKHEGLVWRAALPILLGASVLLSAPAPRARVDAADVNRVAGLKDAKVAFDITAGDGRAPAEHPEHDRRDARIVHQARHHAPLPPRLSRPGDAADADRRLAAEARRS